MSHSDQITQDIANILSSELTPSFSWNNSLRPNKSLSLSHTYIAVFLSCKTRYMHMVHTHIFPANARYPFTAGWAGEGGGRHRDS